MIKVASQISTANVTPEQIGACHKVFEGSTPVYKVANSAGTIDENGEIIEYTVRFLGREKGFVCTCKAGENGLLCWHIKASIACAKEERAALKELEMQIAVQAVMADPATIQAAEAAAIAPTIVKRERATAPYQPKAFSILR